jgi:UDP-N-acetylmuramoyl-tripeptide--D-alanyl-D-alanine ligase
MATTIALFLASIGNIINLLLEYKRDLMMLQQNSYRHSRYMNWIRTSGDTTSPKRLIAMVIFFITLAGYKFALPIAVLMILFSGISASKLLKAKYKKPLVFTNRAKRIYFVTLAISLIIIGLLAWLFSNNLLLALAISSFGMYLLSHITTMGALSVLAPVENNINKKYYNEAKAILSSMPELKIIGITGSYGKTSTKHYLYRILMEHFDTLMTPGSFNTPMGVIRTVREHLKPYNEVFIVEMGAKNIGDIKEICDLVNPEIGIVTAVGPQHLESFKSIENVQRTKFELIDALPSNGFGVINNDFEYIANRKVCNVETVRYAVKNTNGAQYIASDIEYSDRGTRFTIKDINGNELKLSTQLVGECNISNLIAAVIVAKHLDVPDDKIKYAVEKIEQVEHRLNLKRTAGGITIIDDAFNSNPDGSRMALEVLGNMKPGRRIVITPGMIELGEKQFELNKELGKTISKNADIAIIVGQYNREALNAGVCEGNMPSDAIKLVDSFAEAQKVLASLAKAGDYVLYENDLPDTFK